MAFAKKTWKDRIAEFPTRRRLTKEDNTSELVTVAREEGTLSQEGDAFSAENMNDLENRIDAEFTALNGNLDEYKYGDKIFGTSSTTIPAKSWAGQWFPLTTPEGYTYFTALCGSDNDVICGVSVANYDVPNNRLLINAYNRHTLARDFSHVYMIPIYIRY